MTPAGESTTASDIHRRLRGLITAGLLAPGERLPTVRQTAADLAVAPGTVARAYKMLEAEGLVHTRTAAGTRVAAVTGVLPSPVLAQIRALVDVAQAAGCDADEVIDVVRAVWAH